MVRCTAHLMFYYLMFLSPGLGMKLIWCFYFSYKENSSIPTINRFYVSWSSFRNYRPVFFKQFAHSPIWYRLGNLKLIHWIKFIELITEANYEPQHLLKSTIYASQWNCNLTFFDIVFPRAAMCAMRRLSEMVLRRRFPQFHEET